MIDDAGAAFAIPVDTAPEYPTEHARAADAADTPREMAAPSMRSEAHEVLAPVPAAIAHARETPPAAVPEPAAIAAAEPARVEPA